MRRSLVAAILREPPNDSSIVVYSMCYLVDSALGIVPPTSRIFSVLVDNSHISHLRT